MKEETIETYIQKFPENIQEILKRVREIILSCNTELEETIKYGIPTFILHGNLVHFAAYKKHLGFYPDPSGVEAFKDKLEGYTISKGGIQFLYTESIPYDLIAENSTTIGVYEGAGYTSKRVYRPYIDCRMKSNSAPSFCPVCKRSIERVVYSFTD